MLVLEIIFKMFGDYFKVYGPIYRINSGCYGGVIIRGPEDVEVRKTYYLLARLPTLDTDDSSYYANEIMYCFSASYPA